jgi:hypothetical protein
MTIQQIKDRTKETSPYFFSPDTLRFFGQTLNSFTVTEQKDGRFLIQAPSYDYEETQMPDTIRYFNPLNNELERN